VKSEPSNPKLEDNPSEEPWYSEGLAFQCTGCGGCCTGAPGYVWVTDEEIDELARLLSIEPEEFEAQFVRRVGSRRSLVELDNYDCVFFDAARRCCTVYAGRPQQCRTWPFWQSNLRSEATWRRVREACPGCGRGRRTPLATIEQLAARVRV
jgi:uncharacterized protein